jgi:ubiquinone/menaquinone biosynthesis C-methylase UbiE
MWEDASGYEAYVGRWSRVVSRLFVSWLNAAGPVRWLDVACGTGALTEAIRCASPEAQIFGIDRSAAYLSYLDGASMKTRWQSPSPEPNDFPSLGRYSI